MRDVGDARMIICGMNKEQTESVVHHALKEDDVREATFFFKCLIPVPSCNHMCSLQPLTFLLPATAVAINKNCVE